MASNKKFKNANYPVRQVTDMRDLIMSSARLYGEDTAYLVKRTPGGKFQPITYNQLKDDINALGTAFINLGLKGKHVGVIGETRYEWIISHFATSFGTGTVAPLDKDLPIDELKNLIHRAHLSTIVYSGKVENHVLEAIKDEDGIEFIISMDAEKSDDYRLSLKELLGTGRKLLAKGERSFIDANIDPDAMAILLFTSGTTGLAKGVMLSHHNIVSNVMNMSEYVKLEKGSVSLSILPIHHTYEFTVNHQTVLYQGRTVAICEGLKHIVQDMKESETSLLLGVPLVFEMMYKRIWKQAEKTGKTEKLRKGIALSKHLDRFNIKAMRKLFKDVHNAFGGKASFFISGAAAIDPEIIDDFNYMGINMLQGYGMTECSPIIAVPRDRYHKAASVGVALPNTEIFISDPDENGIGEVVTKSPSVMLGYYEDEAATESVLKDGWLYTGDYGYMDDEGFLYLTGRKKNVIVTKNGKNIFPEEVEYYLMKSPYIAEVIVTGEEPDEGDLVVVAHIVPDREEIEEKFGNISDEELQKIFKKIIRDTNDMMPSYKRVKKFVIRKEEFEKTSTKKIRRVASATQNENGQAFSTDGE